MAFRWRNIEAVGWPFWSILFFILLGPAIYFSWQIKVRTASILFPITLGAIMAAVAAGVFTTAVNAVLQRRTANLHKKSKKKKQK